MDIHEDRANAVILAANLVDVLLSQFKGTKLAEIRGGDKRNALPREASAIVLVSSCFQTRSLPYQGLGWTLAARAFSALSNFACLSPFLPSFFFSAGERQYPYSRARTVLKCSKCSWPSGICAGKALVDAGGCV